MKSFTNSYLTEHQFAQFLGKSRLYQCLPAREKKLLPNMELTDSQVNIIALKPSTIFSVNRQALHDFYNTDMETLRYNCLMAENLYEMVYSRLLESYCKTPEERYRRLTTRYPKIEQEIPLCKIPSFLNVTPETISHIRNKIVKNS